MKIALIRRYSESSWRSCQTIVLNLEASYKSSPDSSTQSFYYNAHSCEQELQQLANEIKSYLPQFIIFIDHQPHPLNFLKHLYVAYGLQSSKPQIMFHIFGDFILHSPFWQESSKYLSKFKTSFITASLAQKKLLTKFIANPSDIHVVPFCVKQEDFSFDAKKRSQFRTELNITANKKIFLYTGRISYQKNILELIQCFQSACKRLSQKNAQLFLIGPWDDILVPYSGQIGLEGTYFSILKRKGLTSLENVTFIGDCNKQTLVKYYHAADHFMSFSTYNDEDFGMSPAEAWMCGLPLTLSKWGGYQSFTTENSSSSTSFVPINFDKPRPNINFNYAQKIIMGNLLSNNLTNEQRQDISSQAEVQISFDSVAKKLDALQRNLSLETHSEATLFTDFFSEVSHYFSTRPFGPFATNDFQLNDLYYKTYDAYTN